MTNHISIKDIPQSLLEDITDHLNNYSVSFYVFSNELTPRFSPIGSGTLVEVEGTHHILTAAHVWHQTKDAQQICLALTDYLLAFTMPRDSICAKELWNSGNAEWGPDLALLKLALPFVSRIAAHKSFVNLAQQRATLAAHPPAKENGLWAVTGLVGEFSKVQPHPEARTIEVNAQERAFFSGVPQTHQGDGYDYLDLSAKLELPGVPSSFGGGSGGGLWEVDLSTTKSGKISWDGRPHFRGVAFWQSADSDGRRVIRCHGPRSIFERAWDSWALPLGG